MLKKVLGIIVIAAVAAVLVGGCGSSGSDSTTASLSKAEFVNKSEKICSGITGRYAEKLKVAQKRYQLEGKSIGSSAAEWMRAAGIPLLREVATEFQDLGPVEGKPNLNREMSDAMMQAAKGFEKTPGVNPHTPQSPLADFHELSENYGIESCVIF